MPSVKNHIKSSLRRTGKGYRDLHKWMNFEYKNHPKLKRHEITNIPENIEIVKKNFGEDAVREFLWHIKEDYEKSKTYKLVKTILKLKFW